MLSRWHNLVSFAVIALVAAIGLFVVLRYHRWHHTLIADLSTDSEFLTTARGPIEFIRLGDARSVPVLWLHGNPGGYDQLSRAVLARAEFSDGLHSIVPSRPGYLRTPLASGATPEDQAHLFAALLDSLGIAQVSVVGVSGGGPSALQFARLYPARTRSLVLVSAITGRTPPDPVGRRHRLMHAIGLGDWDAWRSVMRRAAADVGPSADTATARAARAMLLSTVPRALRETGDVNDQRQFDRPGGWPIDGITAPTLIVAGTEDVTVPMAQAESAYARIAGSRLVRIAGGHEAPLTHAREVWGAVRAFVVGQAAR